MARRWSCRAAWKIQGRKGVSAHSTLCTSLDSVIPDARGLLEGQRLSRRATLGVWVWAIEAAVSSVISWVSGGLGTVRGCRCCLTGPCVLLGHHVLASTVWRAPSARCPCGPAPQPQCHSMLVHHVVLGPSAWIPRFPDAPVPPSCTPRHPQLGLQDFVRVALGSQVPCLTLIRGTW